MGWYYDFQRSKSEAIAIDKWGDCVLDSVQLQKDKTR